MNLWIGGVPAKTTLPFLFPNPAIARHVTQLLGNVRLHVVVEQDEWRLGSLLGLSPRHGSGSLVLKVAWRKRIVAVTVRVPDLPVPPVDDNV